MEESQSAASKRHRVNRGGAADIATKGQRGAVRRPGWEITKVVQMGQLCDACAIGVSQQYFVVIVCRRGPVPVFGRHGHGPRVGDVRAVRTPLGSEIRSEEIVKSKRSEFCAGAGVKNLDQVRRVAVIVPIDGDLGAIGRPTRIEPGTRTKEGRGTSRAGSGVDGDQVEAVVGPLKYERGAGWRPIRAASMSGGDRKARAPVDFPLRLHDPECRASPKGDIGLAR